MNIVKAYSPMSSRPSKCFTISSDTDALKNKSIYAHKDTENSSSNKKLKSTPVSYLLRNHLLDNMDSLRPPLTASLASLKEMRQPVIQQYKEDNFEVGDLIGKGRFGEVYIARCKNTDIVFAMKVMNKNTMMKYRASKQLIREIRIHSMLDHTNIIRNYGVMQNQDNIYILMEYASEGNLYNKLKEVGKFDERTVSKYIVEVLNAFKYLQDRHILHRDLKPENLLIGCDGELKLADFGWAV